MCAHQVVKNFFIRKSCDLVNISFTAHPSFIQPHKFTPSIRGAMDLSILTVLILACLSCCDCLYREKTSRSNSQQLAKSISKVMFRDISRNTDSRRVHGTSRRRRAADQCGLPENDVLNMSPVSNWDNFLGSPPSRQVGRQLDCNNARYY